MSKAQAQQEHQMREPTGTEEIRRPRLLVRWQLTCAMFDVRVREMADNLKRVEQLQGGSIFAANERVPVRTSSCLFFRASLLKLLESV